MSTTTASNSWLRAQRKSDLVEIADNVGLTKYVVLFLSFSRCAFCASLFVCEVLHLVVHFFCLAFCARILKRGRSVAR